MNVYTDARDSKHRAWRINAELKNPGSEDAAVKSISEQYNAQPLKDAREGWRWIVGLFAISFLVLMSMAHGQISREFLMFFFIGYAAQAGSPLREDRQAIA